MRKIIAAVLIMIFAVSVAPAVLWAAEKAPDVEKTTWGDICSDVVGHYPLSAEQTSDSPAQKGSLSQPKNWLFDVSMQRFIMSHTSYEFGNPQAPFQRPLSRLEFPLNTWWMNFELRRTCPRWSIGTRAGLSVAKNTDGRMQDSDWENPNNTAMLTTYSESACRAEQNFTVRSDVDVNISDWLGLPAGFEVRPLFAFQFQRSSLMAHDGTQWSNGNFDAGGRAQDLDGDINAQSLPGDAIHFRQDYYLYQIGFKGIYDGLKIGKYITIKAHGEADWGPALGYNEDHHLLRSGNRFTYESTWGNSLYFLTGLDMVIARTFTVGLSMDYLWIRTTGVHKFSNIPNTDETWRDGVRVWSDQTSLTAHVSYAF